MQVSAVSQWDLSSLFPRPSRRGFGAFAPGSALISALIFTVIIALALAGMGTMTVSHYNLANTQASSEEALDIAEAGINWELHKITNNGIASADSGGTTYNASTEIDKIGSSLPGTFTVSCATLNGSQLNASTTLFAITCSASIRTATGPATRIVRINAQPYSTFYTLYSLHSSNFLQDGIVINGISGTNGTQSMSSSMKVNPIIKGVVFNGDKAKWANDKDPGGYSAVHNPNPLAMKGTTDIVNANFPGGQDYLAQNNDNNLAEISDPDNPTPSPVITTTQHSLNTSGHQTVTLKGKPGGANYYLSDINMQPHSNLVFDNTNGPINIYYLRQSSGGSYMRGGHALKSILDAPNNAVKMYMSASGGLNIDPGEPLPGVDNSMEVDMGVYNYDTITYNSKNYSFGLVNVDPNVNFRGQIVSNDINVGGNTNIIGQKGYFDTPTEYYGFSGAWQELNGAGVAGGANQ